MSTITGAQIFLNHLKSTPLSILCMGPHGSKPLPMALAQFWGTCIPNQHPIPTAPVWTSEVNQSEKVRHLGFQPPKASNRASNTTKHECQPQHHHHHPSPPIIVDLLLSSSPASPSSTKSDSASSSTFLASNISTINIWLLIVQTCSTWFSWLNCWDGLSCVPPHVKPWDPWLSPRITLSPSCRAQSWNKSNDTLHLPRICMYLYQHRRG